MLVRVQLGGEERRISVDDFETMVRSGEIGPETPVERDGKWMSSREWPGFDALRSSPASAVAARWAAPVVPWGTALAVGIATRIYFGIVLEPQGGAVLRDSLIRTTPAIFERGESWRALTYGLLHASIGHLLSNMAAIAVAGIALERLLGSAAFIWILSSSVLVGGLLSAVRLPGITTVGMSAGDFGLLGACAALGVRFGGLLPRGAQAAFGSTAALCTLQFFAGGLGSNGVDNWCHFGGLVTGIGLGALYRPNIALWRASNRRVNIGVALAVLATVGALGAFGDRMIPWMAYEADGVVAERPAWWGIQVSLSGSRGYGSFDRASAVSLSTTKHGYPPVAQQLLDAEFTRIQRLDPGSSVAPSVDGATIRYATDGETRVATYRIAIRGLYATVGSVDTAANARLAPALVARTLTAWRLDDPPSFAKFRGDRNGWKQQMEGAVAEAELGQVDLALADFERARDAAPDREPVWVAEMHILGILGDFRAVEIANDALIDIPDGAKIAAEAVVVQRKFEPENRGPNSP